MYRRTIREQPKPRRDNGTGRAQRRRWLVFWTSLTLWICACVPSSQVPDQNLTIRDLTPKGPPSARAETTFRVVQANPQGVADASAPIAVVFNRPIRELGANSDEITLPFQMSPEVPGHWRGVGTHAVQFIPESTSLPQATAFTVRLGAEARSLDGTKIEGPFEFSFETQRPRVVNASPQGLRGAPLNQSMHLMYNQPIDLEHFRTVATLSSPAGTIPFRVEHDKEPRRLRITPERPLPKNSSITLTVREGLVSEAGPLPTTKPYSLNFHTYGPLSVDFLCGYGQCRPQSGFQLRFTNPVSVRSLQQRVSVSPPVRFEFPSYFLEHPDQTISSIHLAAELKPGIRYTIRVQPGVKDKYGQLLGQAAKETFTVNDYWPTLEHGLEGSVLTPEMDAFLPIRSRNLAHVELVAAALDPAALVDMYATQDIDRLMDRPGALHRNYRTTRRNEYVAHRIPLANLLSDGRGVLAVGTRYELNGNTHRSLRFLQVTDLAISAKASRQNALVWVTRLSTNQPVPRAQVEVWDDSGLRFQTVTDANGVAQIPDGHIDPREDASGTLLIARQGSNLSFQRVSEQIPGWRLPYYPDVYSQDEATALLFSERGLYRPGDIVQVKGIVRQPEKAGNSVLANQDFTLELYSPQGKQHGQRTVKTSRFGTFDAKLRVPGTGKLGTWTLKLKEFDSWQARLSIEVAEYRPAEFLVHTESNQPEYVRGDAGRWTARGEYLFGGPMSRAKVDVRLTREYAWFQPPKTDGFEVTDDVFLDAYEYQGHLGTVAEQQAALDPQGSFVLEQALRFDTMNGTERVRFEASIQDVSRQTLSGATTALVHPAAYYVGIRRFEDWFVKTKSTVRPEVIAVAPDGARVEGRTIQLELLRRHWTWVKETSGDHERTISKRIDENVGTCQTRSKKDSAASCALRVERSGQYLIRAHSTDAAGRTVFASYAFYAIGAGAAGFQDTDTEATVELVTNRTSYQVGDTATILVKSPFEEAEALVTVERDRVISHQKTTLRGPTPTITIPVTDEFRPNAYVAVHLLQTTKAGSKSADKSERERYRIGYVAVRVDPEARRLNVEIAPQRRDYRPRDEVQVQVSVRDSEGRPRRSEVTLYAVDEGVLSLIAYQAPDPVPVFTRERQLRVVSMETRDRMARYLPFSEAIESDDKGLEGGGGGDGTRSQFKQSAYFNPSLVTAENGKATARFRLPDNLTTYRLMAVAVTDDDRYGKAQNHVIVSKPLMARPALPRFLRAGDEITAGVVVSSKQQAQGPVRVEASAEGITLLGDATRSIELGANDSQEVVFRYRAPRVGTAAFHFAVSSSKERDAVKLQRRIAEPAFLEHVAAYGAIQGAEAQRLGELATLRADMGGLDVSLSTSALVGLDGGMQQLVDYPYLCTEQLSSRLLPMLPLRQLAEAYGFEPPKDAARLSQVWLSQLLKRQRSDGGFAMWDASPHSQLWVTPYALYVLHLAKQQGASIDDEVFRQGIRYLRRHLELDQPYLVLNSTFHAFVLAELGEPDVGLVSRLYEQREDLSLSAKSLLAMAGQRSDAPQDLVQSLTREVENAVTLDGNRAEVIAPEFDGSWRTFHSPLRTQALVLMALLRENPQHPLAPQLARGLLDRREGGAWRTTQENAFALLALNDYWQAQEKERPNLTATVWLGETELLTEHLAGRTTQAHKHHLPMRRLVSAAQKTNRPGLDLIVQSQGSGRLFYEARLHYARKKLPETPLDRGFFVQRFARDGSAQEFEQLVKSQPEATQDVITAGNLVVVDLTIVTAVERRFVVIDDPLPAGLEAVDTRLSTTASWIGEATGASISSERELRDDRVLFFIDDMPPGMHRFRYVARATTRGRYTTPPTVVQEMYQPEVYGRTATHRVEVR